MALLTLGLALSLCGAWNAGAIAAPDKEPDTTLDDHPSGKDKNEERGGSGTQGKSTSDPDGETNGGADKPGGDGGFDADQDGNNGCGNDDDFEDDNNGNCGGRRAAALGGTTTTTSTTTRTSATVPRETRVLGVTVTRDVAVPAPADTAVLGTTVVRSTGTLAATGAPILLWAAFGLLLIAAGGVAVKAAD